MPQAGRARRAADQCPSLAGALAPWKAGTAGWVWQGTVALSRCATSGSLGLPACSTSLTGGPHLGTGTPGARTGRQAEMSTKEPGPSAPPRPGSAPMRCSLGLLLVAQGPSACCCLSPQRTPRATHPIPPAQFPLPDTLWTPRPHLPLPRWPCLCPPFQQHPSLPPPPPPLSSLRPSAAAVLAQRLPLPSAQSVPGPSASGACQASWSG